jgi:hypothetical protein
MIKMDKKKSPKISKHFICDLCDFKTSKQSEWNIHISRRKHIFNADNDKNDKKNLQKSPKLSTLFTCSNCGKNYIYQSGLSRHKNICDSNKITSELDNITPNKEQIDKNILVFSIDENINDINNENKNIILSNNENNIINSITHKHEEDIKAITNLIVEVVKNNNEFQKQMMDFIKNASNTNINHSNNINSNNNQTFNLQLFLNETCKDAMNMSDFINSFDLKMSDLERLGEDGYVKTLSNLIINKVRELDVEKRPIHCSDARREIVFIKDDGVWVKDDEDKTKLRTVVNKVGSKNITILYKWQASHPDYCDPESPDNSTYLNIMMEVMGGKNTRGNEDKVIKRIIKEVVIDKQQYINNKS